LSFEQEPLCYIGRMFLDSQLVPETLVRPRSFVGLMALYESNYLRLLRVVPELERLDGCFRSRVAGECELFVEILERSRYTITLSLTYRFESEAGRVADPDIRVRAYLDGRLAEAMTLGSDHKHRELRRLICKNSGELDARWRRNIILNKWLEYLSDQGHLVLER
jgi:uncharacterized protein YqiB (DUF1249 family)